MRVLQINSGHLFGGIESLQLTLAQERALCPELDMEYALCFEGKTSEQLRAAGVVVHNLGAVRIRNVWTVAQARRTLSALLRERSYDAVICHGSWCLAIFAPAVRSTGLPLILWLHDPLKGKLDWLSWWAQRTQPDLVICNSRYTEHGLHHLYDPEKTRHTVVYCAVSAPVQRLSAGERSALRSSMGASDESCVIVQISRLDPHKGHMVHLEALGRLRDVPNWVCWQVAGPQRPHEAEYLELLRKTANRLGIGERVRFLGWQPDIRKLLAAADIFCQPNSAPEPFGITYIEALYAGLPVVASAMGGAIEIVNSDCGILTAAGDRGEVADALRRLITGTGVRRSLGAAGPHRAKELCDPGHRLHELYEQILTLCPCSDAAAVFHG
jgi:glycosyltransferase involved in cell wall biosynthesis